MIHAVSVEDESIIVIGHLWNSTAVMQAWKR